jgi:hypothetical protein
MSYRSVLSLTMLAAVLGCTLNKQELRRDLLSGELGSEGRLLLPKRCDLTIRTVKGPQGDPGLGEAVWRAADEAVIADEEARRALEANGLRLGVITGALPVELDRLINAPPPHQVDAVEVVRGEGDITLVRLTPESQEPTETSLLLHRQGRAGGKIYQDLGGFVRISASHEGDQGVSLRIVPELHHGPMQRRFTADPNAGPFEPQQFLMRDAQQEETLRELSVTVRLEPGQVAVLGGRDDRPSSLGHVLMTEADASRDRLVQKLLLITARRNRGDSPGASALTKVPTPAALQPIDPSEDPPADRR